MERIEILTESYLSWMPARTEIQLKVFRKLKETSLAKCLKFFRNALKVGRRFPNNSLENLRKTVGNELKSQQDRGEVVSLWGEIPLKIIGRLKETYMAK